VSVARLIEESTSCTAYFAENEHSLEGITENILKALYGSAGLIAIMHPRGFVFRQPGGDLVCVRGSVWVEQELAIAAFIQQVLERNLPVRAYVHKDIAREGLRDKLHINPVIFADDKEVLDDLRAFLPRWKLERSEPRRTVLSELRGFLDKNQRFQLEPYVPPQLPSFDLWVDKVDEKVLHITDRGWHAPREIPLSRILEVLPAGASGKPTILLNGRAQLVTLNSPHWEFFPECPQTQSEKEIGFPKSALYPNDPRFARIRQQLPAGCTLKYKKLENIQALLSSGGHILYDLDGKYFLATENNERFVLGYKKD
jgi:hypothetical protein